MFGSDIIRVKIKGFLRNVTENSIMNFNENGIRNKQKISFNKDDVKYNFKFYNKDVVMIRENEDYINTFLFKEKNATSNYLLKDNCYSLDMEIDVKEITVNDDFFYVKYLVKETSCMYEFRIEVSSNL